VAGQVGHADFGHCLGLMRAANGAVVTKTRPMISPLNGPYPGTRPFQNVDGDRFYGRERESAAVASLWRTNNLTMLIGPTGTGKTSLLQAGVLPLVARERTGLLPPGRISHGASFPAAALPEHNPYTVALLGSWSPGEPATRLADLTISAYLRQRSAGQDGVILAVIDQVEELLAESGPRMTYRRQFISDLSAALRGEPRLHLLLCVRESALDDLTRELGHGAQYRMGPLSFDSAVDAVIQPARGAGVEFEPGAAEHLVLDVQGSALDDAGSAGWPSGDESVQPALLQLACARLWHRLPAHLGLVSKRDMRRYGDAGAALSAYCGQIIAAVADEYDMSAARLRSWLIRTFVNDRGHRGTAYEGVTDTAGMPNMLARIIEDRHLLTSSRRSQSRWYELISDRLIAPLTSATDENPPPADPGGYLCTAARGLAMGQLDLAERYAENARKTAPVTNVGLQAKAQSLLGNLAHERGKPIDAEAYYRRAAALFEAMRDNAAVARQLAAVGQMLLAQGRTVEAVSKLRSAVERLPNDLLLQTELGWALWQLGQARTAEAVFTGVLALDGSNAAALRGRGEMLAERGEPRSALRDLNRLPAAALPSVRAARGLALAQLGEQAKASAEIKEALTDAPRHGPVLMYAAQAAALGGDLSASAELAERAVTATNPPLPPHQREAAQELTHQAGRNE
jgi:tetratricopeptide (TPR) repeat protein